MSNNSTKCVYLHKRPDGSVFYVGMGEVRRARDFRNRNKHWHRVVSQHGLPEVDVVASCLSTEEAAAIERRLISEFGLDSLANVSPGGDSVFGFTHSEETRQRMGSFWLGRKHSSESRERMRLVKLGVRPTEETKKKTSLSLSGRKKSAEHAKKVAEAQVGKKLSAEYKLKLSIAHTGKTLSEEHRKKLSDAFSADKNHNYNGELILFENRVHGKILCTRLGLRSQFGVSATEVSGLVTGRRKTAKGWRLAANDNEPNGAAKGVR